MEILFSDRDLVICVKPVGLDSEHELPDALKEAKYYEWGDNKTEQAAKSYWEKIKGKKL